MSKKVCAFTGHRPQSLPFGSNEQDERCQKLKAVLEQEIERVYSEKGVTHFISGMALGVDTFAAEAVLHLKESIPKSPSNVPSPAKHRRSNGTNSSVTATSASWKDATRKRCCRHTIHPTVWKNAIGIW